MELLERHDTNAVAYLTMNAPERLNALSDEMLAALQYQFEALRDTASVRAVVLAGAGKAFCAGHDLKQMTAGRQAPDGGKAYFRDLFDRCATMMQTIQSLPQPVIARLASSTRKRFWIDQAIRFFIVHIVSNQGTL